MPNLTQIILILASYQYLIIFLAIIIEGPLATVATGFLVAQNTSISIYLIYPLVVIADLIGDSFYYALGRWGRRINSTFLKINHKKFKEAKHYFKKNNKKAIIIGKLTHGLGGIIIFIAGATHMPFKSFLLLNAIMTIPKSLILLLIGYFFGEYYSRISIYLDYYSVTSLIIAITLLLTYMLLNKKIKQKNDL